MFQQDYVKGPTDGKSNKAITLLLYYFSKKKKLRLKGRFERNGTNAAYLKSNENPEIVSQ